jgi:hypothetical protein
MAPREQATSQDNVAGASDGWHHAADPPLLRAPKPVAALNLRGYNPPTTADVNPRVPVRLTNGYALTTHRWSAMLRVQLGRHGVDRAGTKPLHPVCGLQEHHRGHVLGANARGVAFAGADLP